MISVYTSTVPSTQTIEVGQGATESVTSTSNEISSHVLAFLLLMNGIEMHTFRKHTRYNIN